MSTITTPRFDHLARHQADAVTAYAYPPHDKQTMPAPAHDLFGTHWRSVVIGPCVEGAVFEVSLQNHPEIRYSDRDLTLDRGCLRSQFLGEPLPADLAANAQQALPDAV